MPLNLQYQSIQKTLGTIAMIPVILVALHARSLPSSPASLVLALTTYRRIALAVNVCLSVQWDIRKWIQCAMPALRHDL
jgi:hypothetical protein